MHVERIPVAVPTRAPTGRTACYVLGSEEALLVDPPAPDERVEAELDRVENVAVTHHHPDHVGAVAEYAEAADATVWCRRGRLEAFASATGAAPDRLLPAHGPEIEEVRATCERLIAHRLDRERRVRAAVEAGNRTVADIMEAAYDKDLTGVEDLAGATVRAHLEKLRHEGHVRWDGSRADPAGRV